MTDKTAETEYGYVISNGNKVEYITTTSAAAVERFALELAHDKNNWFRDSFQNKKPYPYICIRSLFLKGKFYFWNGLYLHDDVADALERGADYKIFDTFIYYIGQMNERFTASVKKYLTRKNPLHFVSEAKVKSNPLGDNMNDRWIVSALNVLGSSASGFVLKEKKELKTVQLPPSFTNGQIVRTLISDRILTDRAYSQVTIDPMSDRNNIFITEARSRKPILEMTRETYDNPLDPILIAAKKQAVAANNGDLYHTILKEHEIITYQLKNGNWSTLVQEIYGFQLQIIERTVSTKTAAGNIHINLVKEWSKKQPKVQGNPMTGKKARLLAKIAKEHIADAAGHKSTELRSFDLGTAYGIKEALANPVTGSYGVMMGQAGGRLIVAVMLKGRGVMTSHYANLDEFFDMNSDRIPDMTWYQVRGQEKVELSDADRKALAKKFLKNPPEFPSLGEWLSKRRKSDSPLNRRLYLAERKRTESYFAGPAKREFTYNPPKRTLGGRRLYNFKAMGYSVAKELMEKNPSFSLGQLRNEAWKDFKKNYPHTSADSVRNDYNEGIWTAYNYAMKNPRAGRGASGNKELLNSFRRNPVALKPVTIGPKLKSAEYYDAAKARAEGLDNPTMPWKHDFKGPPVKLVGVQSGAFIGQPKGVKVVERADGTTVISGKAKKRAWEMR